MPNRIYITEGLTLRANELGEADKVFSFFTEDFGRVEAMAQGVRFLKSKLRYSLNGFSLLKLAFVQTSGDFFRITDASEISRFSGIRKSEAKAQAAYNLMALLGRFIKGQEEDRPLWAKLLQLLDFLEKADIKNLNDFKLLSELCVLRQLGYVDSTLENICLKDVVSKRQFFTLLVDNALKESQL